MNIQLCWARYTSTGMALIKRINIFYVTLIQCKLEYNLSETSLATDQLILGSDEKIALRKATRTWFPGLQLCYVQDTWKKTYPDIEGVVFPNPRFSISVLFSARFTWRKCFFHIENSSRCSLKCDDTNQCPSRKRRLFDPPFLTMSSPIVRKSTNEHPIMPCPVYLYWDGSYYTYQRFSPHIQCKLEYNL